MGGQGCVVILPASTRARDDYVQDPVRDTVTYIPKMALFFLYMGGKYSSSRCSLFSFHAAVVVASTSFSFSMTTEDGDIISFGGVAPWASIFPPPATLAAFFAALACLFAARSALRSAFAAFRAAFSAFVSFLFRSRFDFLPDSRFSSSDLDSSSASKSSSSSTSSTSTFCFFLPSFGSSRSTFRFFAFGSTPRLSPSLFSTPRSSGSPTSSCSSSPTSAAAGRSSAPPVVPINPILFFDLAAPPFPAALLVLFEVPCSKSFLPLA
mmetsp:Transcript_4897/g.12174  ORF Transcript_4897/g.12174 Transcript_4897/m.12174 type:complete len:266 (+) Transcript_4897:208-1005(+)